MQSSLSASHADFYNSGLLTLHKMIWIFTGGDAIGAIQGNPAGLAMQRRKLALG